MRFILLSMLLVIFSFSTNIFSQFQNIEVEQKNIAELKKHFFLRDYESVSDYIKKNIPKDQNSSELLAWKYICLYAVDYEYKFEREVSDLLKKNKDDIWLEFGLTSIKVHGLGEKEALLVAEKLYGKLPQNEDIIFLYAKTLIENGMYKNAIELLEGSEKYVQNKSRFLTNKAIALYRNSKDKSDKDKAFSLFEKAQKNNEIFFDSFFIYGKYLNAEKRYSEATKQLEKAIKLSPNSIQVRLEYWNSIVGDQSTITAEKKQNIIKTVESYRKQNDLSAYKLAKIARFYEDHSMKVESGKTYTFILSSFPNSTEAESELYRNIYAINFLGKDGKIDEEKRLELIKKSKSFLERPIKYNESFHGTVYTKLLSALTEDKNITNPEFLKIAKSAIKFKSFDSNEPFNTAVSGLIKRGYFKDAEEIAGLGLKRINLQLDEELKEHSDKGYVEYERKKRTESLNFQLANAVFKQKRYAEAEPLLIENEAFSVLVDLYSIQREFAKAQDAYINWVARFPKDNKAAKALKVLYQKQNGSLAGFEKFQTEIIELKKLKRKELIIADRVKSPKEFVNFTLKDLNRNLFSSNILKGKIIVINIWATWCSPCIAEMPELQQLYNQYRKDKDVAIITIGSDETSLLSKFMTEKKYDFPVYVDEKYLNEVGNSIYPTTWFIDKSGKVSYIKFGATDTLIEEFSWRIEALR